MYLIDWIGLSSPTHSYDAGWNNFEYSQLRSTACGQTGVTMFTPTSLSTQVWRVTGAVSRLELRAGEENTVVSEPKLFHFSIISSSFRWFTVRSVSVWDRSWEAGVSGGVQCHSWCQVSVSVMEHVWHVSRLETISRVTDCLQHWRCGGWWTTWTLCWSWDKNGWSGLSGCQWTGNILWIRTKTELETWLLQCILIIPGAGQNK